MRLSISATTAMVALVSHGSWRTFVASHSVGNDLPDPWCARQPLPALADGAVLLVTRQLFSKAPPLRLVDYVVAQDIQQRCPATAATQ